MASDEAVAHGGVGRGLRELLRDPERSTVVAAPLVGIVASETLLYLGNLNLALWGHVLTLLFCTLAPLRYGDETATFAAFGFVPLFRLVNLGMPVFFELTVFWFPFIYGPLLPPLYFYARRLTPLDIGLRQERLGVALLLPGTVLAAGFAEIEYSIIQPEALIIAWTLPQVTFLTVVMVGFVGLVEELVFRGVLQRTLQERIGRWVGLVLTSGIFGLMHSGYGLPQELVFAGGLGLVFGLIYDWTDSITLITVMHGVLNVFLFAVIPIHGSMLPRLSALVAGLT